MIPHQIQADHIFKAAAIIDQQGVPPSRRSKTFDVIVRSKTYPPKYLLSVASRLAMHTELSASDFITTEARHFFKRNHFTIVRKRAEAQSTNTQITVRTPSFIIRWENVEFRDVIPCSWLASRQPLTGVVHEMRNPRSRLAGRAKCDVTFKSRKARMDYQPYTHFNRHNDVDLGVVEITLSSEDPPKIRRIEWRDTTQPDATELGMVEEPILKAHSSSPYIRPKHESKKAAAFRRERPGQRKFREALESAYGNRCCVTKCGVREALEGAHIDPYRSPASDHVRNGLLLRKDIHALFDSHLISIDPRTRRMVVAPSLEKTDYKELAGRLLEQPTPLEQISDEDALERHFSIFQKKNF